MPKIEVLNPAPGGRRFTSPSKAQDYVRLGRASFEGGKLRFLTDGFSKRLADAEADVEFARNHGDRIAWNGSDPDPLAMYLPGQVRS